MPLKIPVDHRKLIDSPFDGSSDYPFEIQTSQLSALIDDISHGRRSSYLISGYRGSGKSSLIKKLELEITAKEAKLDKTEAKSVFIFLDVPKYEARTIILRKLIRSFYAQLAEGTRNEDVFKKLSEEKETKVKLTQLEDLYEKTFFDVSDEFVNRRTQKRYKAFRYVLDLKGIVITLIPIVLFLLSLAGLIFGWDLGSVFSSSTFIKSLAVVSSAAWLIIRVLQLEATNEDEKSTIDSRIKKSFYDDEIAEYYLKERLASLHHHIKPVFILDELDKIETREEIEMVINDLKPLLLCGHATFIIVAGQTFYYHYFQSVKNDDHILNTLFAKVHHVELLPPARLRLMFNAISNVDKTKWTEDDFALYDAFINQQIFESRRIPRKFISHIRQQLKWDNGAAWLDVSKELSELSLYSTLITALESVDDKEISRERYPTPIKDFFRAQVYLRAALIFETGSGGFSVNDLLKKSGEPLNPVDQDLELQLKEYLKSLLRRLKTADVLGSKSDDTARKTIYFRRDLQLKPRVPIAVNQTSSLPNDYEEFKRVLKDIYGNLSMGPSGSKDTAKVTEIITHFEKENVFKIPSKNEDDIADVLNTGSSLLKTSNVIERAAKRFQEVGIRFPELTATALEYFAKENLRRKLTEFTVIANNHDLGFDYIARSTIKQFPDILIQVKIRKDAESEQSSDITKAYEILLRHNEQQGKDNCIFLILYTESSQADLERLEYTFKQTLRELYPTYSKRILFLPVDTKNLHFIDKKIQAAKDQVLALDSRLAPFKFFTQKESNRPNTSDDHQYPNVLDLGHHSFKIHIAPTHGMNHWRFGIKFSNNLADGQKKRRLSVGNPIFHLEKNTDTSILKYTYYDGQAKHEFTRDTYFDKYDAQKMVVEIKSLNRSIQVDILNEKNETQVDGFILLPKYDFGFLSAWADGKNYFEFDAIIEQNLEITEERL